MFRWLKGRRNAEKELLIDMVRAAAEGQSRDRVNRALGSAGVQIGPEPDNTQYCIKAAAAVTRLIAERAGVPMPPEDTDDRFVVGIFSFVASNHISYLVGAPFEMVASIVPLDLFGLDHAEEVAGLGDSYNRMATEGRVIEAIGQNIANWISTPTDAHMNKLAELYQLCRSHA